MLLSLFTATAATENQDIQDGDATPLTYYSRTSQNLSDQEIEAQLPPKANIKQEFKLLLAQVAQLGIRKEIIDYQDIIDAQDILENSEETFPFMNSDTVNERIGNLYTELHKRNHLIKGSLNKIVKKLHAEVLSLTISANAQVIAQQSLSQAGPVLSLMLTLIIKAIENELTLRHELKMYPFDKSDEQNDAAKTLIFDLLHSKPHEYITKLCMAFLVLYPNNTGLVEKIRNNLTTLSTTALAWALEQLFTPEELQQLVDFNQSDSGKRAQELRTKLTTLLADNDVIALLSQFQTKITKADYLRMLKREALEDAAVAAL